MSNEEIADVEIDIFGFAGRGEEVPYARAYRVCIDGEEVKINTPHPVGDLLLSMAHKRPCAFELIAEFVHRENEVVEPGEPVDLRKRGLKGFITAHKEIVTIFINDKPYPIERGERKIAEILSLIGQTPEGYVLMEEKEGPPLPLPANLPVKIRGCEIFHAQVQSGGSS
jgi:sulfur carrier protein ThiS